MELISPNGLDKRHSKDTFMSVNLPITPLFTLLSWKVTLALRPQRKWKLESHRDLVQFIEAPNSLQNIHLVAMALEIRFFTLSRPPVWNNIQFIYLWFLFTHLELLDSWIPNYAIYMYPSFSFIKKKSPSFIIFANDFTEETFSCVNDLTNNSLIGHYPIRIIFIWNQRLQRSKIRRPIIPKSIIFWIFHFEFFFLLLPLTSSTNPKRTQDWFQSWFGLGIIYQRCRFIVRQIRDADFE